MKEHYLKKADENLPELITETIVPDAESKIMNNGDSITVDLGNHYVGYFSFYMNYVDLYIDAPVKLYIKFCESTRELDDDFSSYKGRLCASWLQDEIVKVDYPGLYNMPRRYAARYIKIVVLNTPKKLKLSNFNFNSITSANAKTLKNVKIQNREQRLIDKVAVNTLKNCMHRVFEDGPKRDRRLWTGDLRLEALTNYYTFNNLKLVRRCLYLFAASDRNEQGFFPGFLYEDPIYVSGSWFLEDYALLFVVSLCDYYNHTEDKETFLDLYSAAKSQMESAYKTIDAEGIMSVASGCDVFIDWCGNLRKTTALHGVYLYALSSLVEVLEKIGHIDASVYTERLEKSRSDAHNILYDKDKNAFINAKDNNQYSVHSTVWMILGEVLAGEKAKKSLLNALSSEESLKPCTPYMHHYVVEAMMKLGMTDTALEYIKSYWGEMINHGADTFYEAFIPGQPEFSPYGDRMINSMCHAWSCTPSYFIRKIWSENPEL